MEIVLTVQDKPGTFSEPPASKAEFLGKGNEAS
jgi:hypothetical protein